MASTTEYPQAPVVTVDVNQQVLNLFSAQPAQVGNDEVMEVETDQVAASMSKKTPVSSLISAAARSVVARGPTANVQVAPETKKKKSPVKPVESSVLKRLQKQEALQIDCPIVKYPAAILIQNVENFLVKTSEREIHLGSRSMVCKRPNYTAETFRPVHVYNLASPEMP